MALNWSTLVLEVLNFLVLVWLLKHFLYRPVLDIVAQRREAVARTLREAGEQLEAGRALQASYENRQMTWQAEADVARRALDAEIADARARRLRELEAAIASKREKAEARLEREDQAARRRNAAEVGALGARFASRLLQRLAGPALEDRLIAVLQEDLVALTGPERERLAQAAAAAEGHVTVVTAHPLDTDQRERLAAAIEAVAERPVHCDWATEAALVAGPSIRIGAYRLDANIARELEAFAEVAGD